MIARRFTTAVVTLVLGMTSTGAVLAQPANDAFADAEPILALPYADSESQIGAATSEAADPYVLCRGSSVYSSPAIRAGNSVWYAYVPASDGYINVSTAGSNYDTLLAIFTGPSMAELRLVAGACSDDGVAATTQSLLAGIRVKAGMTYYLEVVRFSPDVTAASLNLAVTAAPVYNVTKLSDSADGSCDADCSLREAIGAANAAPGAVVVPVGNLQLTRSGANEDLNATGDLDIRAAMSIYGAGRNKTYLAVDAAVADRALHVAVAGGNIAWLLQGMEVSGGAVSGDGGAIRAQTAFGNTALESVALVGNLASGNGGGLSVVHSSQIRDSVVSLNIAQLQGGGLSLAAPRYQLVQSSQISTNSANSTVGGGGGIDSIGALRLVNSTVSGNQAYNNGGGISVSGGGGSFGSASSTIAANVADADSNASGSGGGIRLDGVNAAGTLIRNSIVADNTRGVVAPAASDCARGAAASAITSEYTWVEAISAECSFVGTGDRNDGSDPLLGPLANNGGTTLTMALIAPSQAINGGDPAVDGCRDYAGQSLTVDQRGSGFARVNDGRCDMGAYEAGPDPLFADDFEA